MRFSGRIQYLDLDTASFTKKLDDAIWVQMRQAAREWLRAILTTPLPVIRGDGEGIGRIPVWTGTARGTLIPLGRYLRVAIPISPITHRRGLGPSMGSSHGHFAFTAGPRHQYIFRFTSDLKWFIENEFDDQAGKKRLTHLTPWKALEVGRKAFNEYMNGPALKKLPRLKDHIRYRSRIIA